MIEQVITVTFRLRCDACGKGGKPWDCAETAMGKAESEGFVRVTGRLEGTTELYPKVFVICGDCNRKETVSYKSKAVAKFVTAELPLGMSKSDTYISGTIVAVGDIPQERNRCPVCGWEFDEVQRQNQCPGHGLGTEIFLPEQLIGPYDDCAWDL